ncbi:type III secretion system translocon subunit SctE [Spartinivicinus ruber]|uniref:type III secretion system translocon subunit SctE n=1 Tax=Spartinivicinus ruber TaxID=2683272 RepID=UPI0013D6D0D1|nr:type III secretion system translocon subunit SctE [Spartinivicinus ruber]
MNETASISSSIHHPIKESGDVLEALKTILEKATNSINGMNFEAAISGQSSECACKHLLDKPRGLPTDVQMGVLREKTNEEKKRTTLASIEQAKTETKEMHEKRREERAENLERHKEMAKAGVWGKIFGWIGAIASAFMAVCCMLTPGLQGVGCALLAVAALTAASLTDEGMKAITSVVESIVKVVLEIPAVKALLEKCGVEVDKDFIKQVAQIAAIGLLAVASIAAACMTGGASLASTVAQFSKVAVTIAQKAIAYVMTHLPRLVKMVEFGVGLGQAAAGAAKGVIQHNTTNTEVLIKKLDALLKDLQRVIEDNKDCLQALIQEAVDIWNGASDSIQSTNNSASKAIKNMV